MLAVLGVKPSVPGISVLFMSKLLFFFNQPHIMVSKIMAVFLAVFLKLGRFFGRFSETTIILGKRKILVEMVFLITWKKHFFDLSSTGETTRFFAMQKERCRMGFLTACNNYIFELQTSETRNHILENGSDFQKVVHFFAKPYIFFTFFGNFSFIMKTFFFILPFYIRFSKSKFIFSEFQTGFKKTALKLKKRPKFHWNRLQKKSRCWHKIG